MTATTRSGGIVKRRVSSRKAIRLPHGLQEAISSVAEKSGVSTQQVFDAAIYMVFGDDAGEIEPVLRDALRSYYHQKL